MCLWNVEDMACASLENWRLVAVYKGVGFVLMGSRRAQENDGSQWKSDYLVLVIK
jgi:hypothetical protein